ncbi:MAG: DUF134 domain-containing protein [Bacteroidales bacterium]|nr:DUF134 domain-containing protein [Bacteroidales bacterium]
MPRQKRNRKIANPPLFKGFKPMGIPDERAPVFIHYEEYEAIRLCDYELHGQVEAAKLMEVSRPTFTRIYESARRKVAQAFAEGKPVIFEGGKVYFDSGWFVCNSCGCWFNNPETEGAVESCPLCGSIEIAQCADNNKPE